MLKVFQIVIGLIATSFFIFPFEFVFLPGINTKMMLAGLGGMFALYEMAKNRSATIGKDLLWTIVASLSISIVSILSMVLNNTNDGSFLTFFFSMLVWSLAAFFCVSYFKLIHGAVNVETVGHYLVATCVFQCLIAFLMTRIPVLKNFVDSFLGGEDAFMGIAEGRVYGIGAALDPSGLRFAAVEVIIAYLALNSKATGKLSMFLYIFSFLFIAVFGNIIARSTTIGVVVGLLYWLLCPYMTKDKSMEKISSLRSTFFVLLVMFGISFTLLYQADSGIREQLRFAFEGFFSVVETGRWETNSTDILTEHMIVWPDNAKTWIIGDGYGANPYDTDMNYIGLDYHGFYMGTDIGYIRFIFYFGVLGLITMCWMIFSVAYTCINRFPNYSQMFLMILLVNLIGWAKVTTDIYMIFSFFICLSFVQEHGQLESDMEDAIIE